MTAPGPQDDRLGALLLSRSLIDAETLQRCKTVAQARGCSLSQILVGEGLVTSDQLRQLFAAPSGLAETARASPPGGVDRTEVDRSGPQRTVVDPTGPSGRMARAALPSRLGPFEIRGFVAEGGMGVVYRALHTGLQRECALKVLSPELRLDDETRERFVAEARIAARVGQHPNLVRVFDAGCDDEQVWMAMELVEGTTLQDRVDAPTRDPQRDARLLLGVCDGLSHVHAHGIIHRDLKPPNVLIDREGCPKLSDFGIAKSTTGGGSLTTTGSFLGTPAYMAPEQAEDSRNVDVRSDVYGMGAILYAILCGRAPYTGRSAVNIMATLLNETPPLPSDLSPDVDPALEAVCLRALERDPAERYADVAELRLALEEALDSSGAAVPARSRSSGRLRRTSGQRSSISGRVSSGKPGSGRAGKGDSGRQGRTSQRGRPETAARRPPLALVGGALAGLVSLGLLFLLVSGGSQSEGPLDEGAPQSAAVLPLKILSLDPASGSTLRGDVTLRGKAEPGDARLLVTASPKGHAAQQPEPRRLAARSGSFEATLSLPDGEWSLELAAQDAPDVVLLARTVSVDSTPPRVELSEVPPQVDLPVFTLSGTAHDASLLTLRIGEHEVAVDGKGLFSIELTLQPGLNAIPLVARDALGNELRKTLEVRRALTELTLSLPTRTLRTNQKLFKLRGAVRPPGASVQVRGAPAHLDPAGQFEHPVSLRPGANTIEVRAQHGEQEAQGSVSVELDTEPPRIELLSTSPSRAQDLTLRLRFSEPVNGVRYTLAEGKPTGEEFEPRREASLPVHLREGDNALLLEARDLAGNEGSLQVAFRVDSHPPTLEWDVEGTRLQVRVSDASDVVEVRLGKRKLKLKKGLYQGRAPKEKTEIVAVDGLGNEVRGAVTPELYYLQDRERWASAAATDQDRDIEAAARILGKAFTHFETRVYSCAGLRHRLGAFRHEGTGIELLLVPGGTLRMGLSPEQYQEELARAADELATISPDPQARTQLAAALLTAETPQRELRLAPFLIGRVEVTNAEWERGGLAAPEVLHPTTPKHPVCMVSWDLAKRWLAKTGLRLPSELEWEYACKAGSTTRYYWGDTYLEEFTAPPAPQVFPPPLPALPREKAERWNAFGLIDMSGNASEWCEDLFSWSYSGGQGASRSFSWQSIGLSPTNKDRVLRGGNRFPLTSRLRSTARFFGRPDDSPPRRLSTGLRVAQSLSKAKRQR